VVDKTTVERINPASGRVVESTGVGLSPAGIAVGDGSIWVADATQDTVTRIDPVTNTSITTPVGHGASAIVAGSGSVWVADSTDNAVVRIDPQTNAVTTTVPVGRLPIGLAMGGGSLWAANSASGTVSRIDPKTGQVTQTIQVGSSPAGTIFADGLLWVSVQANAIGAPGVGAAKAARLDLQTDADMLSLDPAITSAPDPWQIEYATCAKLMNFPDQSGQRAVHPVPEVSALPRVSANGRTYTFRIGAGFRFSPPSDAPLTAQTFSATIERTLDPRMHSPIAPFMRDIVGANSYMAGRTARISGVSARGALLTIRLLAPDPTLLVKLAMPYFCAVPAGTPVNPAGEAGIPSAGPYYVSSYVPGREIILRRNPNYRGTRPHQIPEFIYTIGIDPSQSVQRIEADKSDYLVNTQVGVIPYADNLQLLARYGPASHAARSGRQQYFINPTPEPLVIWLNTSRPLFAHVNLRRALNYAIDRAALIHEIEQSGGPVFLPSDQYLTPGIPGYQPIHAYPLQHPDLATARRLAGPGRHGTAIFLSGVYDSQNDQIVARALRAIGIDVAIKRLPINALLAEEHTAHAPFDLVSGGIGIDYPDPYDILNTELDGNQITPHQNDNVSNFNNPTYNRELEAAAQLSGSARYRAYAKLDADLVTNAAPMVAFASGTSQDLFSARIGCQTYQPVFGIDLAALCFRK
jgi:YVTN family beta-propeller protein